MTMEENSPRQEQYAKQLVAAFLEKKKSVGALWLQASIPLTKAANKAAERCLDMGANPTDYVEALFWRYRDTGFHPNHLNAQDAASVYRAYVERKRDIVELSLPDTYRMQKEYLRTAITNTNRKLEHILMDDALDFAPWFRVCITKEKIPAVVEKYGKRARRLIEQHTEIVNLLRREHLDVSRLGMTI